MEESVAEVRQCSGLAEIARAVLALSNRLRLANSLPPGAEGNAAQLQVLQRRAAAAFDVTRLPQLLDTRTLVGSGTKLSHVLVAMCASFIAGVHVMSDVGEGRARRERAALCWWWRWISGSGRSELATSGVCWWCSAVLPRR